jgi:hypothetical protein
LPYIRRVHIAGAENQLQVYEPSGVTDMSTLNQVALTNGNTAQGIVPLDASGSPAFPKAAFQQDLIGNLRNGYADKTLISIIGRNSDVDNVLEDLWDGPTARYVFPTTALQMTAVSTSVNDRADGGTGVQLLLINYLDSQYNEKLTGVALNGVVPVDLSVDDIFRINRVFSYIVGYGGVASGNISIAAGGVTYAYMKAGDTTARQAIYTVPAGKTLYISQWKASSGSNGNRFCQATIEGGAIEGIRLPVGTFIPIDGMGTQNGSVSNTYPSPIPVPQCCDVRISVISDNASSNVQALGSLMGWLEDNTAVTFAETGLASLMGLVGGAGL